MECYARDLEAHGRARATVTRRLCTVAGFYRYAEEEGLIATPRRSMSDAPPGLRAPRRGPGPYRGRGAPCGRWFRDRHRHSLVSLLALNGLRVSEATGADIEAPGAGERTPDAHDPPQGRQGRHHPAGSPSGRAIDLAMRAPRGSCLPWSRWSAPRPPRRREDRAQSGAASRARQARRSPYPETCLT